MSVSRPTCEERTQIDPAMTSMPDQRITARLVRLILKFNMAILGQFRCRPTAAHGIEVRHARFAGRADHASQAILERFHLIEGAVGEPAGQSDFRNLKGATHPMCPVHPRRLSKISRRRVARAKRRETTPSSMSR